MSTLYKAFSQARTRNRWLPSIQWKVNKATTDKSIRTTWDDGNPVVFYFTAKTGHKSHVSVQHGKLAGRADVDRVKAYWHERLGALARILSGAG